MERSSSTISALVSKYFSGSLWLGASLSSLIARSERRSPQTAAGGTRKGLASRGEPCETEDLNRSHSHVVFWKARGSPSLAGFSFKPPAPRS